MLPASAQLAQTMSPVASPLAPWHAVGLVSSSLDRLLGRMAPTTLLQLDAVALLNRVDTKFLLTSSQLVEILARLSNDFLRVTLMDRHQTERLTLDLNIQFDSDGRTAVLPGIVIAELKQATADQRSAFASAMRMATIAPSRISKYCVGVRLLV